MASPDPYDAILIKPGGAALLTAADRQQLETMGGHFDPDLGGVVFAETSVPATIGDFMTKTGLKGQRVRVDYDPEWFTPPSPEPVWENLPPDWDGLPPVIDGLLPLRWLWVCSPSENQGRPFDVMWLGDEMWSTKDRKYTPAQALALGWKILATSAEVLDMTHKRVDEANAKRLDRATKEFLAKDFDGSALQVAMITGRISLRAV